MPWPGQCLRAVLRAVGSFCIFGADEAWRSIGGATGSVLERAIRSDELLGPKVDPPELDRSDPAVAVRIVAPFSEARPPPRPRAASPRIRQHPSAMSRKM